RRQHRQADRGLRLTDCASLQSAHGVVGAFRTRPGGNPVLVQPRTFVQEVLRPWGIRSGHLDVPCPAGLARHVEGRRAEDHPANLCLQRLRFGISARKDTRVRGGGAGGNPAPAFPAAPFFWPLFVWSTTLLSPW